MELDDRKLKILEAIVNDYILTAEPIGSRTIAKKYDLGVSSATIRNEMSDLEELGLIVQPHTSSGRIPSDKGYRLYVNKIMESQRTDITPADVINELIANNINKIETLMEETAKALSMMTNYVTVVSEPHVGNAKIKYIQLVPIDFKSILLVVVLNSNVVKNSNIYLDNNLEYGYSRNYLMTLTEYLNQELEGLLVEEITRLVINKVIELMDGDDSLVNIVVQEIINQCGKENSSRMYTSGVNNILGYPEFTNNMEKAQEIFKSMEEKDFLSNLMLDVKDENMEIIIGEENSLVQLKDFSVVKARYKLSEDRYGSIGVIGPRRMNYEQTISVLNGIVKNINSALEILNNGRN